jgi:hypothetical protein
MSHATIVLILIAAVTLPRAPHISALRMNGMRTRQLAATATSQTTAPSEKASRTPAQQKIDSRLLDEIDRRQGKPTRNTLPPDQTLLKIDLDGRALVDIRAEVTPALRETLIALKGTIVTTSTEYRSIVAWLPLLKLEEVASDPAVHSIRPAPQAIHAEPPTPVPPSDR